MKLYARESAKAQKMNTNAVILRILGAIQFFVVAVLILMFEGFFRTAIGRGGAVVCYIVAFVVGFSASAAAFILADILDYLHSIRWNTDGYEAKQDDAQRRMVEGMARDLSAIARALAPEQAQAVEIDPAPADLPESPVDDAPASAPVEYDEPSPAPSDAPVESRSMFSGVALKLLYVFAGLMVVAVVLLLIAIFTR